MYTGYQSQDKVINDILQSVSTGGSMDR
jgi:hypothetical protein